MTQLKDELLRDYLCDAGDHLAAIESALLDAEIRGEEVEEEVILQILRSLHTVKAGAGVFEMASVRELAHQAEHVVGLIRTRRLEPDRLTISKLLRATDALRDLVQGYPAGKVDIATLMAELSSSSLDEPHSNLRAPNVPTPEPGKLRSLLVEDDFSSRLLLNSFLTRYGECHVAVNGLESVDAFRAALDRNEPYHLVCMDVLMPEMCGREAVRRIREMEELRDILPTDGAKIIMTTTVNDIREVVSCFQELCDAYQVKPIDLGKLLQQMKSYGLVA